MSFFMIKNDWVESPQWGWTRRGWVGFRTGIKDKRFGVFMSALIKL